MNYMVEKWVKVHEINGTNKVAFNNFPNNIFPLIYDLELDSNDKTRNPAAHNNNNICLIFINGYKVYMGSNRFIGAVNW